MAATPPRDEIPDVMRRVVQDASVTNRKLSVSALARRSGSTFLTVIKHFDELSEKHPGVIVLWPTHARALAAIARICQQGLTQLPRHTLAELADTTPATVNRLYPLIHGRHPGLLRTASRPQRRMRVTVASLPPRKRVLAAAALIAQEQGGPVSLRELAGQAGVSFKLASTMAAVVDEKHPNLLDYSALTLMRSAIAALLERAAGPFTIRELARLTGSARRDVADYRHEIARSFPDVLRAEPPEATERALDHAASLDRRGIGGFTARELALLARMSEQSIGTAKPLVLLHYPSVLRDCESGDMGRAPQLAAEWRRARLSDSAKYTLIQATVLHDRGIRGLTLPELARLAQVSASSAAALQAQISARFPGLLLECPPAADRERLLNSAARVQRDGTGPLEPIGLARLAGCPTTLVDRLVVEIRRHYPDALAAPSR